MAFNSDFTLSLGVGKSGLTDLCAYFVSSSGTLVSGITTSGFAALGAGNYLWHCDYMIDGFRGGVVFYSAATSGAPLAVSSINPQELENPDVKTSTRVASGASLSVASGALSGQIVTAASGAYVVSSIASGTTYLASGQNTVEIPKGVHTWNYSGAPNVSGQRCLLNAQRKLVNRWDLTSVSGYLAVYAEDDTTVALLQVVGATSGAVPVTSLDTN